MSDSFFSSITGLNSKYTQADATKSDDDTDYSSVDFCLGFDNTEEVTESYEEVTESYNFDTDLIYEDENEKGFNIEG